MTSRTNITLNKGIFIFVFKLGIISHQAQDKQSKQILPPAALNLAALYQAFHTERYGMVFSSQKIYIFNLLAQHLMMYTYI